MKTYSKNRGSSIVLILLVVAIGVVGVAYFTLNKDAAAPVVLEDDMVTDALPETDDFLAEEEMLYEGEEMPNSLDESSITPTTPAPVVTPSTPVTATPGTPTTPPAPVTDTPTPVAPAVPETTYKDGAYTTDAAYTAPSGAEVMGMTLTIKNDVVTAVSGEVKSTNGTSKNYQQKFLDNVKGAVVGKSLKDLKIATVSGASLTTKGFNDAIVKIQSQAQI